MASTIAGLQWPRFPTPKEAPQSMYSWPASSHSVAIDPRTKVGCRLGELANSTALASAALTRSPSPCRRGSFDGIRLQGRGDDDARYAAIQRFPRGDQLLLHPAVREVHELEEARLRDLPNQRRGIARLAEQ